MPAKRELEAAFESLMLSRKSMARKCNKNIHQVAGHALQSTLAPCQEKIFQRNVITVKQTVSFNSLCERIVYRFIEKGSDEGRSRMRLQFLIEDGRAFGDCDVDGKPSHDRHA